MRILESNFPYYGCQDAYEYGRQHGQEDQTLKKTRYRPEIHLTSNEQTQYETGYRRGLRDDTV